MLTIRPIEQANKNPWRVGIGNQPKSWPDRQYEILNIMFLKAEWLNMSNSEWCLIEEFFVNRNCVQGSSSLRTRVYKSMRCGRTCSSGRLHFTRMYRNRFSSCTPLSMRKTTSATNTTVIKDLPHSKYVHREIVFIFFGLWVAVTSGKVYIYMYSSLWVAVIGDDCPSGQVCQRGEASVFKFVKRQTYLTSNASGIMSHCCTSTYMYNIIFWKMKFK